MLSNFNKIFFGQGRPLKNIEVLTAIAMEIPFFPGGIAGERKWCFTPNELVDIYIKGNPYLHRDLIDKGFGDANFPRNKDEWRHAVVESETKWSRPPVKRHEKSNAIALLVRYYLKIDINLAVLGYVALSNDDKPDGEDTGALVSRLAQLLQNGNLKIYYTFFEQLESLRQRNYELADLCCGSFRPPVEERAVVLEEINDIKKKLLSISELIEAICEKEKDTNERTDDNGKG